MEGKVNKIKGQKFLDDTDLSAVINYGNHPDLSRRNVK